MIYIGIGSNLGNRVDNIEKAKYFLNLNGVNLVKISSYYETLSWPDPTNPKFLNIVVESNTSFSPKKFIEIFQSIEKQLGRKKSTKNSPRTCDIDLISYNQKILSGPITIPHKMMHKRNFVLIPLYELDKNWVHPITNFSIRKLIFSLPINEITSIKQI
tara:strand:- start:1166 stop:1642 length:477 start_codon:yes stop_codon:yes gene_type:complete